MHPSLASTDVYYRVEAIQVADPLSADGLLARLPELNTAGDTLALSGLLTELADRALRSTAVDLPSMVDSLALMRDVGMVLGSLKRHGVEPLGVEPRLTPLLLRLGEQVDLVPRDTVQHYTSWNPEGKRRRTYTEDVQERWLQDAVRTVFPDLSATLSISDRLAQTDVRDARFASAADQLNGAVQSLVTVIDSVTSNVSPVFFAKDMRPYFEEITVAGEEYLGPAAAQVPLWLVDHSLWACDRNAAEYQQFVQESLRYSLPDWRHFHSRHKDGPSLVTRIERMLADDRYAADPAVHASAESLVALLRTLKAFRARHIGIAKKAYADDVAKYGKGSGGAPVALLKQIIDLTRENESLLRTHAGGRR